MCMCICVYLIVVLCVYVYKCMYRILSVSWSSSSVELAASVT